MEGLRDGRSVSRRCLRSRFNRLRSSFSRFLSFLSLLGFTPRSFCIFAKRRGFDNNAWYAACSCCLMAKSGSSRILAAISRDVLAFCTAIKLLWLAASCKSQCQISTCMRLERERENYLTFEFSSAISILSTRFFPKR